MLDCSDMPSDCELSDGATNGQVGTRRQPPRHALPGRGPAVTMPDRTLHGDGSLVSNLPAKQLRAGVVVASDVSAAVPRSSGYPRTPTTSTSPLTRPSWRSSLLRWPTATLGPM